MLIALMSVLLAGDPAPAGANACQFISARGADVVVYADTRVGDDGDVLVSYRLDPGQASPLVEPRGAKLRYKFRANKFENWTYSYTLGCAPGKPVLIP